MFHSLATCIIVLHAEKVFPGNDDYRFKMADTDNQESRMSLPKENFDAKGKSLRS
jgi:hypothetical protein